LLFVEVTYGLTDVGWLLLVDGTVIELGLDEVLGVGEGDVDYVGVALVF
jgi:hypothetical protein